MPLLLVFVGFSRFASGNLEVQEYRKEQKTKENVDTHEANNDSAQPSMAYPDDFFGFICAFYEIAESYRDNYQDAYCHPEYLMNISQVGKTGKCDHVDPDKQAGNDTGTTHPSRIIWVLYQFPVL